MKEDIASVEDIVLGLCISLLMCIIAFPALILAEISILYIAVDFCLICLIIFILHLLAKLLEPSKIFEKKE